MLKFPDCYFIYLIFLLSLPTIIILTPGGLPNNPIFDLMYSKLRYIILFFIAGCLLPSCETAGEDVGHGDEVAFVVSSQSRAAVTTDDNITDFNFVVFGDMKFKNNPKLTIFDNTIVKYTDGKWSYANPQYWFPQHEHSFIAMHPDAPAGISGSQYSDSRLSFNFTLPDDYKSANDIMVASHRRLVEANMIRATPIALNFWHILSRINFQLTNTGAADKVIVNEIKLNGINRTGSFTIIPAPLSSDGRQTDDYDFSWSGISNIGNLAAGINVEVPENEARPLFPDNNVLLMLPQPDNNGVIMQLTYTRVDAGDVDEQITLTAETPIGGWQPGKIYTYSLTVSEISKEIQLTVSVKNWQTPKPTTIPVPEF